MMQMCFPVHVVKDKVQYFLMFVLGFKHGIMRFKTAMLNSSLNEYYIRLAH